MTTHHSKIIPKGFYPTGLVHFARTTCDSFAFLLGCTYSRTDTLLPGKKIYYANNNTLENREIIVGTHRHLGANLDFRDRLGPSLRVGDYLLKNPNCTFEISTAARFTISTRGWDFPFEQQVFDRVCFGGLLNRVLSPKQEYIDTGAACFYSQVFVLVRKV